MIRDPNGGLRDAIISAVEILREPAGKEYRSMVDIQRDFDQFVKDFHTCLFDLHVLTIAFIIDTEDKMLAMANHTQSVVRASRKYWTRVRQLFRCINDAIVWIALRDEPSLFVRRTCRKQSRSNLRDQNHESVLKEMQYLFAGGESLPIWNDATRCVDIGDITLFSPRGISFLELKEGKVNERILQMMRKTSSHEILTDLQIFSEKYGEKGMKQIDRIIKQDDRSRKLVDLAKYDDVIDPFLNVMRKAITPLQPLKRYDSELSLILEELRSKDFVEHTIDGCLHILALNRERDISIEKGKEIIKQHLQDKMCRPRSEEVDCRDVILSLESSFDYPTAMPIMLRPWASEDIAKASLGHTEVYFGFDVNAWGRHLRSSGLTWSSKRQGRKELSKSADERLFVVQDRIPQIVGPKGGTLSLGPHFLQTMLCEGVRPKSFAAFYDQIAEKGW